MNLLDIERLSCVIERRAISTEAGNQKYVLGICQNQGDNPRDFIKSTLNLFPGPVIYPRDSENQPEDLFWNRLP